MFDILPVCDLYSLWGEGGAFPDSLVVSCGRHTSLLLEKDDISHRTGTYILRKFPFCHRRPYITGTRYVNVED